MEERKQLFAYRLPFPLQLSGEGTSPMPGDLRTQRQTRLGLRKDDVDLEDQAPKLSRSVRRGTGSALEQYRGSMSTARSNDKLQLRRGDRLKSTDRNPIEMPLEKT